jgi:excisionase family DNA binding protein
MEKLLTAKEVAEFLGISLSTFRRYMAAGECPPFRKLPTGVLRFDRTDVEHWFQELARFNGGMKAQKSSPVAGV